MKERRIECLRARADATAGGGLLRRAAVTVCCRMAGSLLSRPSSFSADGFSLAMH
jgi:hypothetical protein